MADHGQLYRAFLNIFINASQSMENGGRIEVHVREDKEGFYIEIEDTGCGISQENLKRIFNPFFTTKDKGTIAIESREGKGTKVEILLPRPS
jgi:signal transduction histidine kinase